MQDVPKYINARFAILQFVFFMAYCSVMAFVATYLAKFGLSSQEVGTAVAIGSVASALAQPVLGHFADRNEKMSPIAIIFFISLIGIASSALLALNLPAMITALLYTLLIAAVTTGQPFVNALGLSYGSRVNFGLARAFGSISYAVTAALLGLILAEHAPAITSICTLTMFALLIITLRLFPKTHEHAEKIELLDSGEATAGSSFVRKYPLFIIMLAALTFVQLSHLGNNLFLINLIEELGGNSIELGFATAIAAAVEVPAMILYKPLSKRFACMDIILFATFCFLLKALVTALAPSVTFMYAACVLQMLSFALYIPATVDYAHIAMSKSDTVKGQTLVMAVTTMTVAVAGIAGGLVVDQFGVRFAYWMFAACALVAMFIQAPLTIKARRE